MKTTQNLTTSAENPTIKREKCTSDVTLREIACFHPRIGHVTRIELETRELTCRDVDASVATFVLQLVLNSVEVITKCGVEN